MDKKATNQEHELVLDSFGTYQCRICALLIICTVPNGISTMMPVFTQDTPPYFCNDSLVNLQNNSLSNLNGSMHILGAESKQNRLDSCMSYDAKNQTIKDFSTISCNQGWVFETDKTTVVTEWELVCDKAWIKPVITSVYLFGLLCGSLVSGIISDRFGRRPLFLWATLVQFVSIFATGFSVNVQMYAAMMFMVGLSGLMNCQVAVILATEITGPDYRVLVNTVINLAFAFGYMILPLFAYLLPDWRWLLKALGLFGLFYIPTYWWLPESPRWLLRQENKDEAVRLIKHIAKVNGKLITDDSLTKLLDESGKNEETNDQEHFTYLDLFRVAAVRNRTLILCLAWFCVGVVYYAISLNTSNLGGNIYVNCFIAAAVEIPAYIVGAYICEKFGRISTMAMYFIFGGITYGIVPLLHIVHETLALVSAMISKLLVSALFMLVYIYTCEIYPTLLRHMGVGACSTVCRIGSMLVPYLIFAGKQIHHSLPYISIGVPTVCVGLFCLLLPETKGKSVPATIGEALQMKRRTFFLKK